MEIKKENHTKKLFQYLITDDNGSSIIGLLFTVDFFEIDGGKYVENEKARILIEVDDYSVGKKLFAKVINDKVRDSISRGRFYDLVESWNLEFKPTKEILDEKWAELFSHSLKQVKKENIKIDSVDVSLNQQLKYSSSMINHFDEKVKWSDEGQPFVQV